MLALTDTFFVPKRGSSPEEYEDASWVGPDGNGNGEIRQNPFQVAVADGASESLLAGRWARRLVRVFGTAKNATHTKRGVVETYREAARGWDEEVSIYIANREERGSPIQWYEEPGLAKGAHATIVAAEFRDSRSDQPPMWRAVGVGDSCIFQVRDESLYASFPIEDSAAFSYQPPLLASRGAEDAVLRRHIHLKANDWERGDSFYIATDALAAWFLRTLEIGGRPWEPLRDLGTRDAELSFKEWVDQQRDFDEMHDDDTTLVRIDMC
jgi:hypothetical protein